MGILLTADGQCTESFALRLQNATNIFWHNSDIFQSKHLPLTIKLRGFYDKVVRVALHTAGTWSWSKTLGRSIRSWRQLIFVNCIGCQITPQSNGLNIGGGRRDLIVKIIFVVVILLFRSGWLRLYFGMGRL